jgi:methyl-accepting chemotaxis protein
MKRWSLNTKIYSLIGILIFTAALISYMAVTKLGTLNESLHQLTDGPVKRQKLLLDIQGSFFLQQVNEKNMLLASNDDERNIHEERFKERHEKLMGIYNEVYPHLIPKNQANLKLFLEAYDEFLLLHARIEKLSHDKKMIEAAELSMIEGRVIRLKAEEKMKAVMDVNVELVKNTVKNSDNLYESAKISLALLSLISILVSAVLAFFVLKSVSGAIKNVIDNLNANSEQMTSAAKNIATSSEQLSQATTEQAASLEQTAASIEEMNTMVQKNAENARRTSLISVNSNESALKGKDVVTEMIHAIEDISDSNEEIMEQIEKSNQQISEIVKVIGEIGNKTKVINDIVFQTKLLSFNASVESARAGEHGKGFAVVAEEVGNLAEMSGKASHEISAMLDASIHKVQGIVDETRRSVDRLVHEGKSKVDSGTMIAHQCGSVLEEIVKNVSKVSGMADEISSSCQEQALGVQEITKAMHQLDQVTQANAQTSVQTSNAADDLSSQANSLRRQVDSLIVTVMGDDVAKAA